ncbi:nuclear transport factor 2 family protein [Nocardioides sp. NPDC127503]|uniref:nuclear transport factor 2 family protein n=1 Tax=Nocardioides sp. NPDC127503 TaxID=3154516 RepID=UPI0033226AF9
MSIETPPSLVRYYAAVDASDFDTGMALVTPDVEFAILLPNRAVRGIGREDLVAYLSGRGDVVRRHVPQRSSVAGNLEFVYGAVLEDETTVTGHFLAAARLGDDGLISAYQVAFDPKLGLLPD